MSESREFNNCKPSRPVAHARPLTSSEHDSAGAMVVSTNHIQRARRGILAALAASLAVQGARPQDAIRGGAALPAGMVMANCPTAQIQCAYGTPNDGCPTCTALSGSISTVWTGLSWICVGINSRRALPSPVCA